MGEISSDSKSPSCWGRLGTERSQDQKEFRKYGLLKNVR
jgi:hypothetical protein